MKGLGIITYRRFDYIKQCLESCKKNNYGGADLVVVVEDDNYYTKEEKEELKNLLPDDGVYISKSNGGVASAKNVAVIELLNSGCDELFLMEEDILMKSPTVCDEYINCAKKAGIEHMNFALHGEMNKGRAQYYKELAIYPNCVGAFSYYTKNCFIKIGLFDKEFFNAWEHVFHTLLVSKKGLTTPFWHFADHPNSGDLLEEIPGSIDGSSIRPRSDWQDNIKKGYDHAISKYGFWLPPR